mgnify:CR=1 FL=1
MKKFDILRYLRRFFALVLAVTMAGTVVVYWYCKNNQTYTASVNIKYLHDGIKDGFAPDGTAMNVDEIYSSKVISQAMESLGLQSGINLVRSHCTVEELIPDDQKALQEALIDKGEESTYFPDEYKVTLVVDGSLGASYARRVLDAIVSSYSTIYTEEYVELPLTMNPSSGLLNSGYDYYECVDVLSSDTTEVLNYLEDKKTNYPNFRSSVTGYSYEDLYDIYKMLYDYEIPSLYANVMTGPQVRNADKLCRNLTQSIESSVQNEQVYQEREAYLSGLIQNYSEKNRDLINYHYHNDANDSGTDYILKNVEAYDDNQSKQITYDSLILEYVEIDKTLRSSAIRRAYTQQLLDTFQAAGGVGGDEASHAAIESEINKYEQTLVDYYQIVNQTSMEHNRSLSADYLQTTSSTRVWPSINTKLYLAIGFVFFFLVGCALAVVVGRSRDFVEYFMYVDKKTGMPNREKLNVYISGMADRILPEDYTCFALQLDNLTEMSRRFGYHVGDGILKDFSGLLQLMGDTDGTVGYNGAGKFLAFFDECSTRKAEVMIRILQSQVDEYNKLNPEYPILFTAAWATTSEEELYHVRDLVRCAQKKMSLIAGEGGAVLAGMERGEA